jgi:hypothetical protein
MSFTVESASLEPKSGSKFIAGGEDMWVHVFDFVTGEEISKSICYKVLSYKIKLYSIWPKLIDAVLLSCHN